MIDWNHDGKIDGFDHGMTAFMLDDMEDEDGDNGTGCCGPTVAMFLMALILPILVTVVFVSH